MCVDESIAASASSVSRITEPAIIHLPQTGVFLQRESLQCQTQRKLQWQYTIHSSIPTTSLPIERTEATVTVPDYGRPEKREAEAVIIDNWPQLTEFRSWKIRFNSEPSHSSQIPEPLCHGLVKLRILKSIDDFFNSAPVT